MPNYLSPGVYVEEVEAGPARSRAWAPPSPPSWGSPRRGPFNEPTLVTNWTQFAETFGGFVDGSLPRALRLRLLPNGGGNCLRRPHRRRRPRTPPTAAVKAQGAGEASAAPRAEARRLTGPAVGRQRQADDVSVEVAGPRRRRRRRTTVQAWSSKVDGKPSETYDNVTTKQGRQQRRDQGQRRLQADRIEEVDHRQPRS